MITESISWNMHKFFTGPCAVKGIAQKLCKAGFDVFVGTEHLYVSTGTASFHRWELVEAIERYCGTTFGLR